MLTPSSELNAMLSTFWIPNNFEIVFIDTPSPQLGKEQPKTQCHVKPNYLFGNGVNPSAIQIAIDWDPTALHLRYQSTRERVSYYFMEKYVSFLAEIVNKYFFQLHFRFGQSTSQFRSAEDNKPNQLTWIIACEHLLPKRNLKSHIIVVTAKVDSQQPRSCKSGNCHQFWSYIWNASISSTINGWNRKKS